MVDQLQSEASLCIFEWSTASPIPVPHCVQEEFGRLLGGAGDYDGIKVEDWTPQTLPSWRHSIWVGVFDPWIVIWKGLTR